MFKYLIDDIPVVIPESFNDIEYTFDIYLEINQKIYISFINPDLYLSQEKNNNLKAYFQNAAYNFIDGIGLLYAINRYTKIWYTSKDRYAGTDFFSYLPEDKNIKMFLYGAKQENLLLAIERIHSKYTNIHIVDSLDGYSSLSDEEIVERINSACPDIVMVCLGCPKQELWIQKNIDKINAKILLGNGGAIDFWSGKVKRAPVWVRNSGMEWAYRLLQDFGPSRIKRQLKIVPFFINILRKKYKVVKL